MSTLYVDRRNVHLDSDGEALVFHENGERIGTVPMAPLQRVFIRGGVELSTTLLGKLGSHGIGVVILSGRKGEPSLFLPRPHNDATRRLAQFRAAVDESRCLALSRHIVRDKLLAQLALLKAKMESRPDARYELKRSVTALGGMLDQVSSMPSSKELRGLEGASANMYFSALAALVPASLGFHNRNRRPPRDPFNAVLSLGYTLLHAEAVLAGHGAGLDPAFITCRLSDVNLWLRIWLKPAGLMWMPGHWPSSTPRICAPMIFPARWMDACWARPGENGSIGLGSLWPSTCARGWTSG